MESIYKILMEIGHIEPTAVDIRQLIKVAESFEEMEWAFSPDTMRQAAKKYQRLIDKPWENKSPWGEYEVYCLRNYFRTAWEFVTIVQQLGQPTFETCVSHLLMAPFFVDQDRRYHLFSPNFLTHLKKTNLKVKTSVLRQAMSSRASFFCETQFGVFDRQPDGAYAQGFFALYRPQSTFDKKDALALWFPDFGADGKMQAQSSYLCVDIESYDTIEDSFNSLAERGDVLGVSLSNLDLAIKMILYASSGDPDLRHELPIPRPKTTNPKKLRAFEREHPDNLPGPATLVGYGFLKERLTHVDSTIVKGFWRWQPYGPELKQVKLIWIDEFERKYNKGHTDAKVSDNGTDSVSL